MFVSSKSDNTASDRSHAQEDTPRSLVIFATVGGIFAAVSTGFSARRKDTWPCCRCDQHETTHTLHVVQSRSTAIERTGASPFCLVNQSNGSVWMAACKLLHDGTPASQKTVCHQIPTGAVCLTGVKHGMEFAPGAPSARAVTECNGMDKGHKYVL